MVQRLAAGAVMLLSPDYSGALDCAGVPAYAVRSNGFYVGEIRGAELTTNAAGWCTRLADLMLLLALLLPIRWLLPGYLLPAALACRPIDPVVSKAHAPPR